MRQGGHDDGVQALAGGRELCRNLKKIMDKHRKKLATSTLPRKVEESLLERDAKTAHGEEGEAD